MERAGRQRILVRNDDGYGADALSPKRKMDIFKA
jgi:hypothetical protein